jgi:hypothetical protein
MDEDEAKHRAERAERADYHVAAQPRRSEAESAKARVLVDRFVAEAQVLTTSPSQAVNLYCSTNRLHLASP